MVQTIPISPTERMCFSAVSFGLEGHDEGKINWEVGTGNCSHFRFPLPVPTSGSHFQFPLPVPTSRSVSTFDQPLKARSSGIFRLTLDAPRLLNFNVMFAVFTEHMTKLLDTRFEHSAAGPSGGRRAAFL
jgi:hypothetical protein